MTALGTLAAGIAHDFNNILSIIKGSAQIVEENLHDPAKIRTRLDRIKTVVGQGGEIVRAMLGFSRSSDEPTPADLNGIVEDTLRLLGDRFLRNVEIQFDRRENLPRVSVPRDFVQQIILNFVFNAAEAMSGNKRVVIRTEFLANLLIPKKGALTQSLSHPMGEGARRAGEGLRTGHPAGVSATECLPPEVVLAPGEARAHITISVQDFGCGISPENLPRIFEPFFTTKAMSARRGTGLGLSMVYELARKMDSGLAVESELGRGSTFTLLVPVKEAEV